MKLADKLVNSAINANVIPSKDKELYSYSIGLFLSSILVWGTILLIGFLLNVFWETLISIAFFAALRRYAGGFHLDGYLACYLGSVLVFAALLLLPRFVANGVLTSVLAVLVVPMASCIYVFAPSEDSNKPLSKEERVSYRLKTRLILMAEIILIITGFCFSYTRTNLVYYPLAAINLVGISLILNRIKTSRNH